MADMSEERITEGQFLLLKRARVWWHSTLLGRNERTDAVRAAVAEIEFLRARLSALRGEVLEALEPFAKESGAWADRTDLPDSYEIVDRESCATMFVLGDLRRAAAAYEKMRDE